jgi:putative heme-binding domain-containing protein
VDVRRNAVWTLSRIGSSEALAAIRAALDDTAPGVRQAAAFCAGSLGDRQAVPKLIERLSDVRPEVCRQAATALGQIGTAAVVPPLLDALAADVDRVHEHSLIYALIEAGAGWSTVAGLSSPSPRVRRGALIALDQMAGDDLSRDLVAPLLDTSDFALQKTALEVIGRHPDWGDEIVDVLTQLLSQPELPAERQAMVRGALYAFRSDEKIQQLVADRLSSGKASPAVQQLLLQTIARSDLQPLPQSWTAGIGRLLGSKDGDVLLDAVAAAASADGDAFRSQLVSIAANDQRDLDLRIAALGAVAERGSELSSHLFTLLDAQLSDSAPPMRRLAAARALGAAKLNEKQLVTLADRIAEAGPLEFAPLLGAFERAASNEVGTRLVTALAKSPAAEGLTETQLARLLEPYPDEVKQAAAPLAERLRAATAEQRERLAELLPQTAGGDAQLGHGVFFGKKASCYACHRVGTEGGAIGPDLSTIGQRRNRRDLLEAVLYPSASLARGFESYTISTDAGRVHTGLIVRETADVLELRTEQQQELRLKRSDVEAMRPSPISIMPAGLDKTVTPDQLRDLLAYLESLR